MKIWRLGFALILLLTACKCNNGKDKQTAGDTLLMIPDTLLVYDVNTEARTMKRFTEVPDSAFTVQRVVNGLNQRYPNVQVQILKQGNDTLYITVPNDNYLAEKMGSAGSENWFATTILNLTAITGINYVNIDLEEGDHALPGVFSKENYTEYKQDSLPH